MYSKPSDSFLKFSLSFYFSPTLSSSLFPPPNLSTFFDTFPFASFQFPFEASKAVIGEGPEVFVRKGAILNLSCLVVDDISPNYVFWYHDGTLINYDPGVKISSVTSSESSITSRLQVVNTQITDAGRYSCLPSSGDMTNVTVHVVSYPGRLTVKFKSKCSIV